MDLRVCNNKQIKHWAKQGKRFVCIGAGKLLENLCKETQLENSIDLLVDNNSALWHQEYALEDKRILLLPPEEVTINPEDEIVLITTTYHAQVKEQLEELENWKKIKRAYYFPSEADKCYNRLAWLWKNLKLQKKVIFRSGLAKYVPGFDYSDNAKALFDYMLEEGYNNSYKLVWYVHNPEDFPEVKEIKNVEMISYEWEKSKNLIKNMRYFYHLCTAKYIFFTDTHFWLRYCKKGQIRVNLWHGCGFKDRKTKSGPCDRNYDYMTVTSPLYGDIHAVEYGCKREKMLETGLAKQDLLFKPLKENLDKLFQIPEAKKYIFWLPTFRMAMDGLERLNEYELDGETGLPIVTTIEEAKKINALLEEKDLFLIIKLHPIQKESVISKIGLTRIRVIINQEISAKRMQINDLLSKADALISDYSSVAVDYMLLDRPIAFMLEDEERYKESRGFVFDNIHDFLPGKELYTLDDLEAFIIEVARGEDSTGEKRKKLLPIMHSHQDGNNSKRILEAVDLKL